MRLENPNKQLKSNLCFSDSDRWAALDQSAELTNLFSPELIRECLGSPIPSVDLALSRIAANRINVPEPSLIRAYLNEHLDLLDVLTRTCRTVSETFRGDDAQLLLTVYSDPEIENKYLILYIRKSEYPDDFVSILNTIYAEYASSLLDKSGWFQVTTDFARPAN